jgi:hypothetical protein
MSFQYDRDDSIRRVVVTYQGEFEVADGMAVLERHQREDVGNYGILYDVRRWTGFPSIPDLRLFMSKNAADISHNETRGPIAILATEPVMYSRACAYAVLGRPILNIKVFRDSAEAETWLTSETT